MKNFGLMGEEVVREMRARPEYKKHTKEKRKKLIAIGNREATTVTWFWLTSLSNFLI